MSVFSFTPACLFFRLEEPHLAAQDPVSLLLTVATSTGTLGVVPCVSLGALRERNDVVERPFKRVRVFPVGFLDRLDPADRTDPSIAVAHRKATDLAVVWNTEPLATGAKVSASPLGSLLPDPKELDPIQPSARREYQSL
jgi:hypothetical protein